MAAAGCRCLRGRRAATVRRLARDGAHVALTYDSSADAAEAVADAARAEGVEAEAFQFSADESGAAAKLIAAVVERFGGIDILVNNAGVSHTAPVVESDDDLFAANIDANVRAVFETVRAAAGMTAIGRYGVADEIAAAIAFFASPEASYVTGAELTVDSGLAV